MKKITPVWIQTIESSIVAHDVKFTQQHIKAIDIFILRGKKYFDVAWIKLRPVMDAGYTIFNPEAPILISLN